MKTTFLSLLLLAGLIACKTTDKEKQADTPKYSKEDIEKIKNDTTAFTTIEWLDPNPLDLGQTKAGSEVEVTFRFKNTGAKPLIIEDVTAQCGCTIPEKPQQPFAPGEEGVIKAKFNSSGYKGLASKQVTVKANTAPTNMHVLTFNVQVND